jgi:hypothetical protein
MRLSVGACALLILAFVACDYHHGGGSNHEVSLDHSQAASDAGAGEQRDGGGPGDAGESSGDAETRFPPPRRDDPWNDVATRIGADVREFAAALCDRYLSCQLKVLAGDREGCIRTVIGVQLACSSTLEELALPELDACKRALADADCRVLGRDGKPPAACDSTLATIADEAGASGEHEACGPTVSCSEGLSCTASANACGTCAEQAQEHEDCTRLDCADGLYCESGRCTTLLEDDERCTLGTQCASGYCDLDQRCATPQKGDDCKSQCGSAFFCVDEQCDDGVTLGGDCRDAPCVGGLVCVDDQCVLPSECGQGEKDDPCQPSTLCSHDLYCDRASSRCERALHEGQACALVHSLPCEPGLTCQLEHAENVYTCQKAKRVPGATCSADSDCNSLRCVGGTCSASGVGGPCHDDGDCASGACDFHVCVSRHAC